MIHGGGPGADGWNNWISCLQVFSAKYRAIAIDLAGYGGTEAPEGFVYSQENRNKQLVAFIEALDAGPVSVVGNSMGGATGLGAAMLRPDLITSLVLMGSAGLHHDAGGVARAKSPISQYDYTLEGMKRIAGRLGGKHFRPLPGMLEYRFELATRPERRASFEAINKWLGEQEGLHFEESEIVSVKTRSLVFGGKEDLLVPMPKVFRFLELLENSSGFILPHCGHWAMLEHPKVFSTEAIAFLDGDAASVTF